jgi:hypothetical protein
MNSHDEFGMTKMSFYMGLTSVFCQNWQNKDDLFELFVY